MSSAGARVHERAFRFSDDLLVEEGRTFARLETYFVDGIPDARAIQERVYRRGLIATRSIDVDAPAIGRVMVRVLEECKKEHRRLLARGIDLVLKSMKDELGIVEASLPMRHRGLTKRALAVITDDGTDAIADQALATYSEHLRSLADDLVRDLVSQWRTAQALDETDEAVYRRLFSPHHVPLPNHVGNGLWWKPLQATRRHAREGVIWATNGVRIATMTAFNEQGALDG